MALQLLLLTWRQFEMLSSELRTQPWRWGGCSLYSHGPEDADALCRSSHCTVHKLPSSSLFFCSLALSICLWRSSPFAVLDCICSPYPCGLQPQHLVFPPSVLGWVHYRVDTLEPAHSKNTPHRSEVWPDYCSVLLLFLRMSNDGIFISALCSTHLLMLLKMSFKKVTADL